MSEITLDLRAGERWLLRVTAVLFAAAGVVLVHLHLGRALIVYVPLVLFVLAWWRKKVDASASLLMLSPRGIKGSISVFQGSEKTLLGIFGAREFFIPWDAISDWTADSHEHRIQIRAVDGRSEATVVLPTGAGSRAGRRINNYRKSVR